MVLTLFSFNNHLLIHYFLSDEQIAKYYQLDFALFMSALLFLIFICLFIVFYFIGTGIWMRDQAREVFRRNKDEGQKIWQHYEQGNKLKALAMPFPTLTFLLAVLLVVARGAVETGHLAAPWMTFIFILTAVLAVLSYRFNLRCCKRNLYLLDSSSQIIDNLKTSA